MLTMGVLFGICPHWGCVEGRKREKGGSDGRFGGRGDDDDGGVDGVLMNITGWLEWWWLWWL